MTPTHGRSPKGCPLRVSAPGGLTFIAALRHDRIVAPCVCDGPINAERFPAWVTQCLVPSLEPGDVVIMDNLSSHNSEAVRETIGAVGTEPFFPPPYSPDPNPVEQVFARLKRLLGKAKRRTKENTWRRIGRLPNHRTPKECPNDFRNSGYAHS